MYSEGDRPPPWGGHFVSVSQRKSHQRTQRVPLLRNCFAKFESSKCETCGPRMFWKWRLIAELHSGLLANSPVVRHLGISCARCFLSDCKEAQGRSFGVPCIAQAWRWGGLPDYTLSRDSLAGTFTRGALRATITIGGLIAKERSNRRGMAPRWKASKFVAGLCKMPLGCRSSGLWARRNLCPVEKALRA
jgi:hypothetical protein